MSMYKLFILSNAWRCRPPRQRPGLPCVVGASIARPPAAAEMQFAFRLAHFVFATARPVMPRKSFLHSRSVSHRCKFSQADGQWPPLRVQGFRTPHYCRGEHRSSARRQAGSDTFYLKANCPSGRSGRPMAAPTVLSYLTALLHGCS